MLTQSDLSSHTHRGELEQFYPASWILTSIWALLCATGCKGCSNLAPDLTIPCQNASPFYIVLWTGAQSQKCWAEMLLNFPVSQNHQVISAWGFYVNSCTGDLISDLGRSRPCSSSERLDKLHLFILFLQPLFPPLPGAPNHCPGWQPWKPQEIYESKWHTLTDFHEI